MLAPYPPASSSSWSSPPSSSSSSSAALGAEGKDEGKNDGKDNVGDFERVHALSTNHHLKPMLFWARGVVHQSRIVVRTCNFKHSYCTVEGKLAASCLVCTRTIVGLSKQLGFTVVEARQAWSLREGCEKQYWLLTCSKGHSFSLDTETIMKLERGECCKKCREEKEKKRRKRRKAEEERKAEEVRKERERKEKMKKAEEKSS